MRYHPQSALLAGLVPSGEIGQVDLARWWFSFMLDNLADIRLQPDLGGGSLWDLGCYPVTLFRTALRVDPVEVSGWRAASPSGVDITFAGQIRYRNGAIAQIATSMRSVPA